jgi:hypothetical protein
MTLTATSDEPGFWEISLMNPSGDKPEILLGRRQYHSGNR